MHDKFYNFRLIVRGSNEVVFKASAFERTVVYWPNSVFVSTPIHDLASPATNARRGPSIVFCARTISVTVFTSTSTTLFGQRTVYALNFHCIGDVGLLVIRIGVGGQ